MKTPSFFKNKNLYERPLLLTVIFSATILNLSAKIWRVNGNPGVTGSPVINLINDDQNSLIVACTTAASGDTIIVEPLMSTSGSTNYYNRVTVTRKLKFFGSGYFLPDNANTQANPLPSIVRGFVFDGQSAGSEVHGMTIQMDNLTGGTSSMEIRVDDIILRNCNFIYGSGCGGTTCRSWCKVFGSFATIERCFFSAQSNFITTGLRIENSSVGNLIANNIFDYNTTNQNIIMEDFSSATIMHNIFTTTDPSSMILRGGPIQYNIFTGTSDIEACPTVLGGSATCNVFFGSTDTTALGPSQANNIRGVTSTLFDPAFASHPEKKFKLNSGSLYFSVCGVQPGPFGGTNPYELSGMPPIPAIFYLMNDACTTPGNPPTLRVHIKSKAHN